MSDQERPPQNSFAELSSSTVGLPFTAERLASLQPRLRLLLAEFQALDALVPASMEPAFTPLEYESMESAFTPLEYDEGGSDAD